MIVEKQSYRVKNICTRLVIFSSHGLLQVIYAQSCQELLAYMALYHDRRRLDPCIGNLMVGGIRDEYTCITIII